MDNIKTFVDRLKRIGVEVEVANNYPWIYLFKVNGNVVTEKLYSEHKFTLAMAPLKENQDFVFTDISAIFNVLRKYSKTKA